MWPQRKKMAKKPNGDGEKKARPLFSSGKGKVRREHAERVCGITKALNITTEQSKFGWMSTTQRSYFWH
jgi:hypothetical protein